MRESAELRPLNAYEVSKATQDLLGYQYHRSYGLPVVRVRPSAHTGPGQTARFVTAAFARQISRIEAGLQAPILSVGNLQARRDFTDVRDVVRAYRLALHRGEPGEVYNVGGDAERENIQVVRAILKRLDEPEKNWKFSLADAQERRHWNDYMRAYEDMIRETATPHAPWVVVPGNKKWFARWVVAAAVIDALQSLKLAFPTVGPERKRELAKARMALVREGTRQ